MMIKKIGYIVFVLGAAIFVLNDNYSDKSKQKIVKLPQEYMQQVKVTNFTEFGKIKNYITATHWEYLPKLAVSKLENPKLSVIKPNNAIWSVSSDKGVAKHKSLQDKLDKLELQKNVVITRPKVKITTSSLDYYPKTEYVYTKKFVKMLKPGLQITGVGLQGYLNQSWVELQNNVKTIYITN